MENHVMKISKETIEILKNFATINPSILLTAGNEITTISPQKNMFVSATIAETFEYEYGIYDLPRFLGVDNLFSDPDYIFGDKYIEIASNKKRVRYGYASKDTFVYPLASPKIPSEDIKMKIAKLDLAIAIKAASVLQSPDFIIKNKNGKIVVRVSDDKDEDANNFNLEVGETDKEFNMIFKIESLVKLIPMDYTIVISEKGLASFSNSEYNDNRGIEYKIAVETRSTYVG